MSKVTEKINKYLLNERVGGGHIIWPVINDMLKADYDVKQLTKLHSHIPDYGVYPDELIDLIARDLGIGLANAYNLVQQIKKVAFKK